VKLPFSRKAIWFLGLAGVSLVAAVVVSGAAASTKKIQVCALLPDTTTSVRYVLFDAPDLSKAFKAAGLKFSVLNAQGSTSTQISQAEQCITNGAKVILVDALDSGTGATIEANAKRPASRRSTTTARAQGKIVCVRHVGVGRASSPH
jgi:ABC-type xylose transport system substrate-binding protein